MLAVGLVLCLILGAVVAQAMGLNGHGSPTVLSPYPLPLTLLAFLEFPIELIVLGFCVVAAIFSHQLLDGDGKIPLRTVILYGVSVALSAALFVSSWKYGVKYQGPTYVIVCASLSAALALIMATLLMVNRRRACVAMSAAFHFLLFAWLGTYALPYLGETP